MISPQEPAGNNYYYPTRGTTRVSVTHPASAYAYWRARIGAEIAADILENCGHKLGQACGYCTENAHRARGEQ